MVNDGCECDKLHSEKYFGDSESPEYEVRALASIKLHAGEVLVKVVWRNGKITYETKEAFECGNCKVLLEKFYDVVRRQHPPSPVFTDLLRRFRELIK